MDGSQWARVIQTPDRKGAGKPRFRGAKLKPLFGDGDRVTAGNAPGINDSAAEMIVAGKAAVRSRGLTPQARIIGFALARIAGRISLATLRVGVGLARRSRSSG